MRNLLLKVLRESSSNAWAADQLERTLAQGLSMTVKDTKGDAEFYRLEPSGLSAREKKKREAYETTRAYTEDEAIALIENGFHTIFVTLPAVQASAMKELRALGRDFENVEFVPPDEPGRDDKPHTLTVQQEGFSEELATQRVQRFLQKARE